MRKILFSLMLGMLLISMASAGLFTDANFVKDNSKIVEKGSVTTNYGKYIIEDGLFSKEKWAEIELIDNTDNCIACSSTKTIILEKEMALIEKINYYEKGFLGNFDKKSSAVSNVQFWLHTSYKYDYETRRIEWEECDENGKNCVSYSEDRDFLVKEVPTYRYDCVAGEPYYDEESDQMVETQECSKVQDGTKFVDAEEWEEYTVGTVMPIGNYTLKQTGFKKANKKVDWVVDIAGKSLDAWAVWGEVDANITDGLVAQYRMNTNPNYSAFNQTIVFDRLGLNNGTYEGRNFSDGNVSGGVTIEDGAMKFDGVSGYVSTTAKITNFSLGNTISSWVYIADGVTPGAVFLTNKKTDFDNRLFWEWTTSNRFEIRQRGGSAIKSFTAFNTKSTWYHIVQVINTNLTSNVYVNGAYLGQIAIDDGEDYGNNKEFIFGRLGDSNSNYANGSIDDTLIFNRALSQDEITQLYNQGRGKYSSVTDGLVAQYSGRDFAGTTASPTIIYDTNHLGDGKVLESLSFDGVDDYVDLGDVEDIEGIDEIAISLWFKTNNQKRQELVTKGTYYNSNSSFGLEYNGENGRINWAISNSRYRWVTANLQNNTWYHITTIYSNLTDEMKIYVNGVLATGGADDGNFITIPNTERDLRIGGGGASQFTNGSLDDVRIYNRSLSEAEIQTIYYNGLGTEAISNAWGTSDSPADDAEDLSNTITLESSAEIIGAEFVNVTFYYRMLGGSWIPLAGTAVSGYSNSSTANMPSLENGTLVEWYAEWEDSDGDTGTTEVRSFRMEYLDDIVLQLKLNSNTGTTAYDSSGNLNHGTISGATWDNDGVLVSLVEGVDYTLNTATGLLTLGASYLYDYVVASWDYYTTSGNQDYNVAGDMETGLGEFGKWFSLLVVVFIAGVILFLFKDSFKQEGDGQGY